MKERTSPKTVLPNGPGKVLSNNPLSTYNYLVKGEYGVYISIDYGTISSFYNNVCRHWIIIYNPETEKSLWGSAAAKLLTSERKTI